MKALLSYVILVGGSLVALIGIFRFGRDLTAPPSIDGRWKIDAVRAEAPAGTPCLAPLFPEGAELRVFQSGIYVIVVVHDAVFRGQLERDRIRARAQRAGTAALRPETCPDARELQLDGVVTGARDARRLSATLSLPECAACSGISLRAARLARELG